jgi:hypothetical protein
VRFSPAGHPFAPRTFVPFGPVHNRFVGHPFGFHHNHFFFNNCFGFACGSPFFFGGFGGGFGAGFFFGSPFFGGPFLGAPFWGPPYYPYDYGYGYGPPAPPAQPVVVNSDNGSNTQLAVEVQRLSDEVEDMRNDEARRLSQERAAAANQGQSLSAQEPAVATVFVFQDGLRISARSYAIAGQTLWVFDEHVARKYQLTNLDGPATEKANAANGVEFHAPAVKH